MAGTVTRADLAEVVKRVAPVSGSEAARLVDEVIEHICRSLEVGEDVKLSSFATFSLSDKSERIGRNPKTGEEKVISPRRVISFTASRVLKEKVTAGRGGARGGKTG